MPGDLLQNLKDLSRRSAIELSGKVLAAEHSQRFLGSRYDSWFNQAFVDSTMNPVEAGELLEGRPGFVWLSDEPTVNERKELSDMGFVVDMSFGMTASTQETRHHPDSDSWIVSTAEDLNAWHAIYCNIFNADLRGLAQWRTIHKTLGSVGASRLSLLLGGNRDAPGAIGAVFISATYAGLYCFGTVPELRQRGLATGLVWYSHSLARQHGASHAVLEATEMGQSVYRRCGYTDVAKIYSIHSPDRTNEN